MLHKNKLFSKAKKKKSMARLALIYMFTNPCLVNRRQLDSHIFAFTLL